MLFYLLGRFSRTSLWRGRVETLIPCALTTFVCFAPSVKGKSCCLEFSESNLSFHASSTLMVKSLSLENAYRNCFLEVSLSAERPFVRWLQRAAKRLRMETICSCLKRDPLLFFAHRGVRLFGKSKSNDAITRYHVAESRRRGVDSGRVRARFSRTRIPTSLCLPLPKHYFTDSDC